MRVGRKFLAVAILIALSAPRATMPRANAGGLPVIDASNLTQNIMTAIESVAQTLKQIEQHKTQLQQYENMLQNTLAPAAYIWDQAVTTMNELRGTIDTLNFYKSQLGSIDAYLAKFQDVNYYRNSPCFREGGCTDAQWAALMEQQNLGSQAQKKATDALFKGLDKQQNAMVADAVTLQRLQSNAQGARGQMEALGYANQLASHQANQLLQLRALFIAQQNAIATRQQVIADREAREAAAAEQLRKGTFKPSPKREW
jgi:P-type conjugative transfer protein TrbJ